MYAINNDRLKIFSESNYMPCLLFLFLFRPWDIFQSVADEPNTSALQNTTLIKMIKIVFYVLLFLIVLGTTVTQKLSLFALIDQQVTQFHIYTYILSESIDFKIINAKKKSVLIFVKFKKRF